MFYRELEKIVSNFNALHGQIGLNLSPIWTHGRNPQKSREQKMNILTPRANCFPPAARWNKFIGHKMVLWNVLRRPVSGAFVNDGCVHINRL